MADRRLFLKQLAGYPTGFLLTFINWISQPEISWGAARRLLPKGTRLETLVNENPALLDARDLEIQPLEKFGTMGLSDHGYGFKRLEAYCFRRGSKEASA